MKAIKVQYRPASASGRGSRWTASAEGVKTLTLPYDHDLDGTGNAAKAAVALCERMAWGGTLAHGQLPNGDHVFCFVEGGTYTIPTPPMKAPVPPKTGARCSCKPGIARDNCPSCEGSGEVIDFKALRAQTAAKP